MRLFLMLVCVFFIFGVIVLTLLQPKLPPEVNRILYVRYMISLFGLPVTFAETSHSKYQPKKCMIYLASLAPLDRFVLVLAQRQKGQRILCMKTSMTRRTLVKSFLGSMLQEGIAIQQLLVTDVVKIHYHSVLPANKTNKETGHRKTTGRFRKDEGEVWCFIVDKSCSGVRTCAHAYFI